MPPSHLSPLIHLAKASHANLSLGGGAPTYPATAKVHLGDGALLEGAPATIEGHPTRTVAAGRP
jgi:hypothetical protein